MGTTVLTGRDLGRRIVAGIKKYIRSALTPIVERLDELQKVIELAPTSESLRSEIENVTTDAIKASIENNRAIRDEISELIRRQVNGLVEASVLAKMIELERRVTELAGEAIDKIEKPRDGADGKDGASLTDMDVTVDDDYLMTVKLVVGDQVLEKTFQLEVPRYLGVYKPDTLYKRGSFVTHSGSLYAAMVDTTDRPRTDSKSWRLAVKRGRDGSNAQPSFDEGE